MLVKKAFALVIVMLFAGGVFSTGFETTGEASSDFTFPASSTAVLFSDDFESGITRFWDMTSNWTLPEKELLQGQTLQGESHAWATVITGQQWSDTKVEVKVKLLDPGSAAHLMFRLNDDRGRYIVGFNEGEVYLERENPWENFAGGLAGALGPYQRDQWYTLKVEANLRQIVVSVNGSQVITYTDNSSTIIWNGTLGFEVVGPEGARVRFDDVTVTGSPPPSDQWVKTGGPVGGLGYDVRYGSADQQVMYVTDNYSGVNKSRDGGQNWFTSNRGILARFWPSGDAVPIFTLSVDQNKQDNIWAGLKDVKGLYKSGNGGQLWQEVTPAISDPQFVFRGVTVQDGNSNIVYAGGEIPDPTNATGKTFGLVRGRVYKTIDGGQNWTPILERNNLTRYIIIHPTDPKTIYVSLGIFDREASDSDCTKDPPDQGTGGVVKTTNGGTSWDIMNNGLTDMNVGSLVMHPNNPEILLAGAGNNACSTYTEGGQTKFTGGVFITIDGGKNWTKTLANEIITSVEFSPSSPNIAYAGSRENYYCSEDGGNTWDKVAGHTFNWGPPGIVSGFPIDILVDPTNPATMFVNNYGGSNVKSTDGGATWQLASKGYTGALMFDLAVHPDGNSTVYAAARSGVFRSVDGGGGWHGLTYSPAGLIESYSIAVHPTQPNIVLASQEEAGVLYRSTTGGTSWIQVDQIIPRNPGEGNGYKRIEFTTTNPQIVYGGTCRNHNQLHGDNTVQSFGIRKSTDAGLTWNPANGGKLGTTCINDLAVHPDKANTVYAATAAAGLWKTTDGGSSWNKLSALTPADVRSVAIDQDNPKIVYAGIEQGGVYRSTDGGTQWTQLSAGMEPNDSIRALEINPSDTDIVYAGSFHTGVYIWDAAQNLWFHFNGGLRTRAVTDLAITNDGKVLYASTWGEGVFRLGEVTISAHSVFIPLAMR